MEEPRKQRIITFKLSYDGVYLSSMARVLIFYSSLGQSILVYDARNIKFLKEIKVPTLNRIVSLDVSACENYLLVVCYKAEHPKYPFVMIWELSTAKLICYSLIKDETVV